MSDLELSDPYDPEAFEHRPGTTPRTLPPATQKPQTVADAQTLPDPPTVQDARPDENPGAVAAPWKAAASSVPKLRQQPAPLAPSATDDSFQGFAQDAMLARGPAFIGESRSIPEAGSDDGPGAPAGPLALEPPFWEVWLERVRAVPLPLVLGACGVLVLAVVLVSVFRPRDEASVSLSRIRQHPEAYDGRRVAVSGRAGEGFSIGGSYVFNLRQGRDTIVVYSRTRRPSLHENVQATGTVSIGYLDGAPRVALFEEPQTP